MASQVSVPLIVAAGVAILAGFVDFVRFRIPNAITVPFLVSGFTYHIATGGLSGLGRSAGGCLICFLIVLVLYIMGAMGAGDVKFTAGIGAWLGMELALLVFLLPPIATAIYSLAVLAWQKGISGVLLAVQVVIWQIHRFDVVARHIAGVDSIEVLAQRQDRRARLVPFAVMLAVGVLAVVAFEVGFSQPNSLTYFPSKGEAHHEFSSRFNDLFSTALRCLGCGGCEPHVACAHTRRRNGARRGNCRR